MPFCSIHFLQVGVENTPFEIAAYAIVSRLNPKSEDQNRPCVVFDQVVRAPFDLNFIKLFGLY